ncbi:hypothetical protein [Megalodesulfovibrio paquesii]
MPRCRAIITRRCSTCLGLMAATLAAALSLAACAGEQRPVEPPHESTAALAAEFEGLCLQQATPHLGDAQARSMCGCMADNHRTQLAPGEIRLLIRDYRGEISEEERQQNMDLNQLFVHDTAVAEACQKDPTFRIDRRLSLMDQEFWGVTVSGTASMTASAP